MGSKNRKGVTRWGAAFEQLRPLDQRFAHQPEFEPLEIAQAAVNELGRCGGGGAGVVALLGEHHFQPAARRVARDGRTVDSAADDEEIEGLIGQR